MNIQNTNLRVLNITHFDLDGAGCNILLKNIYKEVQVIPVTYQSEKSLLEKIPEKKDYDVIICTDFYPKETIDKIRSFGKPVFIFDHHETVKQYNNGKDTIIDTRDCATKLIWKLYNGLVDLNKFKELVDIIDDFDMYRKKDIRSPEFNKIFWEMNFKWFVRRFINGNITLSQEEKQYLIESKEEIDKIYNNLAIVELDHKGVYFELDYYQFEITERLKSEGYQWFMIKNKNNLSIRSNDNIDLLPITYTVGRGGGHPQAIGIPLKYKEDIKPLINKIIKAFNDQYPYL